MTARLLLVSALGASCGFSPKPADVPPDVATMSDTPPMTVDTDGDGIPDSSDNCPTVYNPDQADKDGDGRGDVCDLCPHIASVTDPDMDGDGVGDACDPRPTTPGDHLTLFDGFYTASDITMWMPVPGDGNWSVLPGSAAEQDSATMGDQVLEYMPAVKKTYSAASFKLGTIGNGGGAGICSGVLGTQHYCCVLLVDGSGSNPMLEATDVNGASPTPWSGSFKTGDTITIVQNLNSDNIHCDATVGTNEQHVDRGIGGGATNGSFELYTASTSAAFNYAFVVEIGP